MYRINPCKLIIARSRLVCHILLTNKERDFLCGVKNTQQKMAL